MNLVVFIVLWVLWRQQELCHQKPKTPPSHLTFAPQGIVAHKEQSALGGHKATTGRQQDVTDSYWFS